MLLPADDDDVLEQTIKVIEEISFSHENCRYLCQTGEIHRFMELLSTINPIVRESAVCVISNIVSHMRYDRQILSTVKKEAEGLHVALRSVAGSCSAGSPYEDITLYDQALQALFAICTVMETVDPSMSMEEFGLTVLG